MPEFDANQMTADKLFQLSLEKAIIPFQKKLAPVLKDSVIAEIDAQNLIDTGAFRASIQSEISEDSLTIDVTSKGLEYPIFLEFGTETMSPKAPFRNSAIRVREALR